MADERLASGHVNPEEHAVAAQAHISAGTMAAKVPGPVGQAVAREHAKHAERHIDVAERLKRGERPEKVIRYNIRYTGWGKSEPPPDGEKFFNPLKQGRDRLGRFAGGPPGSAIAAHVVEGEVLRAFAGSERHRREEPDISPPGPGPALPPAETPGETARRLRAQRGLAPLGVRERSRMLVPTHETGQFVVWHDRDVDYAEARHAARAADRGVRNGTVAAETAAQAHEVAAAHAAAIGRDSLARRHHTRAVQHRSAQLAR